MHLRLLMCFRQFGLVVESNLGEYGMAGKDGSLVECPKLNPKPPSTILNEVVLLPGLTRVIQT